MTGEIVTPHIQPNAPLQTRTEHSRSLDDAEKFRAIEVLEEVGLLISVDSQETFHGRVAIDGEVDWSVSATPPNSSTTNTNPRPTLYTGSRNLAEDFAEIRALAASKAAEGADRTDKSYRPEVHEIVAVDTDAKILNFDFDETNLDTASHARYALALEALALPITEGSPVSFDDREAIQPFMEALHDRGEAVIAENEVANLALELGIKEQTALQLVSAHNARQLSKIKPSYLVSELLKSTAGIVTGRMSVAGAMQSIPMNLEYAQRWMRNAHVVGVRQRVGSSSLGDKITSVSFVDLEKTRTVKDLGKEELVMRGRLGAIAVAVESMHTPDRHAKHSLLKLLEDAHVKPHSLLEAVNQMDGYAELLDSDTGTIEGFTLGQHIETVLRNFDENYADTLPVELLRPMRLAIIAHDLGKSTAAALGQKENQKEYNLAQASDFLDKLRIDGELADFLYAIIGDGEELAFEMELRDGGEQAERALRELATSTLGNLHGAEHVTSSQIDGFVEMCKILVVCDGGAYTSMATTSIEGGYYRNEPSFNSSFAPPTGFGNRTLKYRELHDSFAPHDLTPKAAQRKSRLRISHGSSRSAPTV